MGKYDPDFVLSGEPLFERASVHFGDLKKLPAAEFRGLDCRLLAEQYRRVRDLEPIESTSPTDNGKSSSSGRK